MKYTKLEIYEIISTKNFKSDYKFQNSNLKKRDRESK